MSAGEHADGLVRCPGIPAGDELYLRYHDEEWCQPKHDDRDLYELFVIELFQAGLSWRTLLHKRENFRRAYDGFDVDKVAAYGDAEVERLMNDPGIIRHRGKILASIGNSRVFRDIQDEFGSFDAYVWGFTDGKVLYEPGGAVTKNQVSDALSRDLKRRGVRFAGSVTMYSYLQAVGVIYSHAPECFCYARDGWEKCR